MQGSKKEGLIFSALLLLLFCFFPMEHKYDKIFRHYSLTLIPPGLDLPSYFDKKIYFYASDLLALFLVGWGFLKRKLQFFERAGIFPALLFCCAFLSLLASPLKDYSLPYIRLFQLLTPIALFLFLANGSLSKERLFKLFCWGLFSAGLMQALIATVQYFQQHWLGLRFLSEQRLGSIISVPGGRRWLFDKLLGEDETMQVVYRAMGTMPHANILGGFLVLTLLLSAYLFYTHQKQRPWLALAYLLQLFALAITYSRAAIFAYLLSTLFWFGWMFLRHRLFCRATLLLILLSGALVSTLLQEQYIYRGGVVNYTPLARISDQERFFYQDVAFRMIAQHPLLGVGYGQFSYRSPSFLPVGADPSRAMGGVHNVFLMTAAEMGLIALAALLFWLFTLLRAALRSPPTAELGLLVSALLAFLFIGCCDFYPILAQQGKLLFFGIAGMLARFSEFPLRATICLNK